MTGDLGLKAKTGARSLLIAQLAKFLVNMATLVVLSRILSPTDFGYAAIALAIVTVGDVLRDMGLSTAAIRVPSLAPGQRDVLFWCNTLLGVAFAAIAFLAAPFMGELFGDPVAEILRWLSIVFVLGGVGAQYRAELNRSMRFGAIAFSEAFASVIAFGVALVLAFMEAGYWAIVAQNIVVALVILISFVAFGRWRPRWPRRGQEIRGIVLFGVNVSISQMIAQAGSRIDTVALGYFTTPAAVGLYDRAFQLVMSPLNQLKSPANTVALPSLSKVLHDREKFQRFLLRGQLLVGYTVLPAAAVLGAASTPIVLIALGEKWAEVAPIVAVLVIAGAFQQMSSVANWTFLAQGLGKSLSAYSLVSFIVKLVIILLAAPSGPFAVSIAYLVSVVPL